MGHLTHHFDVNLRYTMLSVLPAVYLRGSEQPMSKTTRTFRAIPRTTLRHLRNTPSYFFLIWRWTFWFFALINIVTTPTLKLGPLLLVITFLQALVATLYTPVFRIFLP